MTPPIHNANGTQFTQPSECSKAGDAMPALPSNIQFYNQVPLYQPQSPHRDMKDVLQDCCSNGVWIFSDPDPCTAICDSRTAAEAKKVMYCLNGQNVVHGTKTEKSSAAKGPAVGWVSLLVGAMLLSGMLT
ncbi:uncharacterized protein N7500_009897 [Penicillium coprophilum]|uniref:uncharacterized protein n=1 Tax=Penicillium coprophilum TaxID=36646 RepID=UPI00238815F2|nr:uncharacterized protein N7500_009897 [Penicillium coprophilum]KAJ5154458.1 hypothetical protein N7500_009897 [Penicillium coprophilum]